MRRRRLWREKRGAERREGTEEGQEMEMKVAKDEEYDGKGRVGGGGGREKRCMRKEEDIKMERE